VLKDHSIPGENRVALSKSLATELRRHKQKSRDHLFELYLLAAGIRQEYLDLANGHYSDEFNSWYTSENIKDVFGKLSNFTKYASAGEAIAYVAELGSTPKKYLPNLPTSMIALYAISQIIKRHPDAFAVCLNFTPRRKTLTSDKTDWITKKPALIHEDVTQNELNTWLQSWENPEKTPKAEDKYRRNVKLLTVSVSQDIFSFDEVRNKTGEVDIDELQDLIAKIQKMFSADNEKQFLLETEIDRISERYSAKKDKNDPLVILQKTPKADRAKSYK
jgi:hypothetical protein